MGRNFSHIPFSPRRLPFFYGWGILVLGALGFLRPGEPGTAQDTFNLALAFVAMLACGVPIAGFMVVPHVIISQLVDRDGNPTRQKIVQLFQFVQGIGDAKLRGPAIGGVLRHPAVDFYRFVEAFPRDQHVPDQ